MYLLSWLGLCVCVGLLLVVGLLTCSRRDRSRLELISIVPFTVARRVQQGSRAVMAPVTRLFSTSKSEEKGGGHSVPGAYV